MPELPEIAPGAYVLDTHALFALLQDEPGRELIAALIERATPILESMELLGREETLRRLDRAVGALSRPSGA